MITWDNLINSGACCIDTAASPDEPAPLRQQSQQRDLKGLVSKRSISVQLCIRVACYGAMVTVS